MSIVSAKPMLAGKFILGVDFDGTITTEPDMGKPLVLQPFAKEALTWMYTNGVTLVLWTCRTGKALDEACDFLVKHDMLYLFTVINDQIPEIVDKYSPNVARKLGADFYLDDKNLIGGSIDWRHIQNVVSTEIVRRKALGQL